MITLKRFMNTELTDKELKEVKSDVKTDTKIENNIYIYGKEIDGILLKVKCPNCNHRLEYNDEDNIFYCENCKEKYTKEEL